MNIKSRLYQCKAQIMKCMDWEFNTAADNHRLRSLVDVMYSNNVACDWGVFNLLQSNPSVSA